MDGVCFHLSFVWERYVSFCFDLLNMIMGFGVLFLFFVPDVAAVAWLS